MPVEDGSGKAEGAADYQRPYTAAAKLHYDAAAVA